MIKVSAETREMMVWIFNKFGDRSFTFEEVSDTISPSLFEKFKVNKFVVKDDLHESDTPESPDVKDWWRINWASAGDVIKKKKKGWK